MILRHIYLVTLILFFLVNWAVAQTVFDDGGIHLVTDDVEQSWITVDNATTLEFEGRRTYRFVDPLLFPFQGVIEVRNDSALLFNGEVQGGSGSAFTSGIYIEDSRVEINGGEIETSADGSASVELAGNSQGSMSNGEVSVNSIGVALVLRDTSRFRVLGGTIAMDADVGVSNAGVAVTDQSMLTVMGGEQRGIGTLFRATKEARIVVEETKATATGDFERTLRFFSADGSSAIAVKGGVYSMDLFDEIGVSPHQRIALQSAGLSSISVTGGEFSLTGRSLGVVAEDQSMTKVIGAKFVYPKHTEIIIDGYTNTFFHASDDATIAVDDTIVTSTIIAEDDLVFFRSEGSSEIHIAGGDYSVDSDDETGVVPEQRIAFHAADQSSILVAGGKFTLTEKSIGIVAEDEGVVQIEGTDFNYPMFEALTDLEGTITGVLLDGNPFEMTFQRDPTATIILIPEPSAITLSAFGFLGLLGCRRKKNAA